MSIALFASCSVVEVPKNAETDKVKGYVYAQV